MHRKNTNQQSNTRHLFKNLVARKPAKWDDIPEVKNFTGAQVEALRRLPVLDIGFGDECSLFGMKTPREFIGLDGEHYFYISTDGRKKISHAFRLPGAPESLKPPPYKVWVVVEKLDDAGGDPEELDLPFGATTECADEIEAMGFAHLLHEYGISLKSK